MPVVNIDTDQKDQMSENLVKEIEKSLDEYSKDFDSLDDKKADKKHAMPPHSLAQFVKTKFDEADSARQEKEKQWLHDLRQFRGQYDPEILTRMSPNRSRAFVRITRNKVKTVDSRLTDFLFPANGDKNWNIKPTPLPELSANEMAAVVATHQQQTGEEATPDQIKALVDQHARKKAKRMATTIADQLSELKYRETLRDVLHSGNLYGTGVLKGPMVSISTAKTYKRQKDTEGNKRWVYEEHDTLTPFIEAVPIWDIYPDMSAVRIEDCRYVIQRHKMDKNKVIDLGERSDFDNKVISKYLRDNPDGDYERSYHETEIQSMGNRSPEGSTIPEPGKKYEILEYWGYVDPEELEQHGVKIPEKIRGQADVACNLWVVGDYIIKATLAPMQGIIFPYFFYYYDKDETSIWGDGIASIMKDVQELMNASFRAMLDNAAISAGPQIEANLDLLNEDEDPSEIYPFKVWLRSGEGADATAPAIRVETMPSYTNEYINLNELLEKYSDEITTIPRYMWGDQAGGAGRTASGLSMMLGSANITIKDQVKNFDDGITKPFISALYHWNMQFNSDNDIKGDYKVVAQGTSSLIAKEVQAQSLMNFANITNNPVDLPTVKREKIIRGIADSLDLGDWDLVRDDTEIAAMKQQQAQQQEAERQFMSRMTEIARESGVSPTDLINNLREVFQSLQQGGQV